MIGIRCPKGGLAYVSISKPQIDEFEN